MTNITPALEVYKNHINYVWIDSEVLDIDYSDIIDNWFVHLLTTHGNPFCQNFMAKVWDCMETIYPFIDHFDEENTHMILQDYFDAYFDDNLSMTQHQVECGY
jgi:hypothetical protein